MGYDYIDVCILSEITNNVLTFYYYICIINDKVNYVTKVYRLLYTCTNKT